MPTRVQKSPDQPASVRLTKSHVERLQAPTRGQRFLRDTELKGFNVRVTSGGAKSSTTEIWMAASEAKRTFVSLNFQRCELPLSAKSGRRQLNLIRNVPC